MTSWYPPTCNFFPITCLSHVAQNGESSPWGESGFKIFNKWVKCIIYLLFNLLTSKMGAVWEWESFSTSIWWVCLAIVATSWCQGTMMKWTDFVNTVFCTNRIPECIFFQRFHWDENELIRSSGLLYFFTGRRESILWNLLSHLAPFCH